MYNKNGLLKSIALIALASVAQLSFANSYECEVTSYSGGIFALKENADNKVAFLKGKIPPKFYVSDSKLYLYKNFIIDMERPPKNGVYHATGYPQTAYGHSKTRYRYRVNIDNNLKGFISLQIPGMKRVGPIPITCKPKEASSKTCENNVVYCSDEKLCSLAVHKGAKNWTSYTIFQKYVKEAKRRGLTCGISGNSTSNSHDLEIDNAKRKCTRIGYKTGTEKHADCVLQLLTK